MGLELAMCMVLDICGGEASKLSIRGKFKNEIKLIDLNYEKFLNSYWIFNYIC